MEILDIRSFNLALMTKWWWSILRHLNGTLQRLLKLKYGAPRRAWRSGGRREEEDEKYLKLLERSNDLQKSLLTWCILQT